MTLPTADKPRFFFRTKTMSEGTLEVGRFLGTEGISEPYYWEIDLVCDDPNVDFLSLIGESARLKIKGRRIDRYVHGIVSRFEMFALPPRSGSKKGHGKAHFRAWLVPPHLKLALKRRMRVFQNKTTRQIVTQVLQDGNITDLDWKGVTASYSPRGYCVQYRESDWDFVCRLLEEEGISYHFDHGEEKVTTVFTDHSSAFKSIEKEEKVIYNADTSMVVEQEYVHNIQFGQQMLVSKVELRDYDFKEPNRPVKAVAHAKKKGGFEVYDYPGEFIDSGLGKRLAQVRLEELQCEGATGTGGSDCSRFMAGRTFKLGGDTKEEKHPRRDLNQEFLLIRVTHAGEQPQVYAEEGGKGHSTYGNKIIVMPTKQSFRPPRVTPRPQAVGTHTAVVVGPSGEDVYVDKYGRVKVQFHWDRDGKVDENSSCWVRVSHAWAGQGFGAIFLPRIGQEVLISFLEGDPDRPLITGRVFNGVQDVPSLVGGNYVGGKTDSGQGGLPANKTRSSIRSCSSPGSGSNEIRFEDRGGSEQIYIHAEKDLDFEVENNMNAVVKGGVEQEITEGRKISAKSSEVDITNGSTHKARTVTVTASQSLTLKCGMSKIELTPSSIMISSTTVTSTASAIQTIQGTMVKIN